MPKTIANEQGIQAGDDVIVYWKHSDIRALPGAIHHGDPFREPRWAKVDRVTRTQVIVDGIRFYDDGQDADRGKGYPFDVPGRSWAFLYFAHPNNVPDFVWAHLLAHTNGDVQPLQREEPVRIQGEAVVLRGVNVLQKGQWSDQLFPIGHAFPMLRDDTISWGVAMENDHQYGQYIGRPSGFPDRASALDALIEQHQRKVEDKQEEATEHERQAQTWERFKRRTAEADPNSGNVVLTTREAARIVAYAKRVPFGL